MNASDLSDWYNQVNSQFEGVSPPLTSLCLPYQDKTFVALLFDTDNAPFIVKNPAFGLPGGGSVEYEVPWRESTSIRTANRAELIKILSSQINLPKVEVTGGIFNGKFINRKIEWALRLFLYIEPISSLTMSD